MDCPSCGQKDLHRDSVDNGFGVQYGPFGCRCGWSEWEEYDTRSGPKYTQTGYKIDPWGGATPPSR